MGNLHNLKLGSKRDKADVARNVGQRMREARELCNMSQTVAAKRLGYANSSKLSKVETCSDAGSIPLWLIRRAAEVYEVSIDYLFGATEDWEVGARMLQEREVSAWVHRAWHEGRERDLLAVKQLNDRLAVLREAVAVTVAMTEEVSIALDRFSQLNPEFEEDMRGSNRLVSAVKNAAAAAGGARAKMVKLRLECEAAQKGGGQACLFDEERGGRQ